MGDIVIAITAASYSGNKGAAAMLQSSIKQLHNTFGHKLTINLMSTYPVEDSKQVPYDFIKVIPCKPEALVFIAFPLSIIYKMLKWFPPVRYLLEKNKIIQAYKYSDLVLDEAGVSFVDSRGWVMNMYSFICIAVPMLVGTPVVKYSQALGGFTSLLNRSLAKIVLPKCKLICARGQTTLENLKKIGIKKRRILFN
jgi:polysaccharide pyruvyl transferase WcaK-like protein